MWYMQPTENRWIQVRLLDVTHKEELSERLPGSGNCLENSLPQKGVWVRIPPLPQIKRVSGYDGGVAPVCKIGTLETQRVRISLDSQQNL